MENKTLVSAGKDPATVPTERLCSDCQHDDQSAGKHKGTTDAVYKVLTYGCNEQDASGNAHCGCKNEFHFRAAQGDGQSGLVGRELDAAVAERVMGFEEVEQYGETVRYRNKERELEYGGRWSSIVPSYSTDIAAAMEVVEKMREKKFGVAIDDSSLPNPWLVDFDNGKERGTASAATLSEAICRAALAVTPKPKPKPWHQGD